MRDNFQTALTTDALLERAREIARLAAEQAQTIEQQRRLPDALMQALKDSELLRVLQHPVQRIWRDLHAISQHIALHYEAGLEAYGRTLVGLPSGSPL